MHKSCCEITNYIVVGISWPGQVPRITLPTYLYVYAYFAIMKSVCCLSYSYSTREISMLWKKKDKKKKRKKKASFSAPFGARWRWKEKPIISYHITLAASRAGQDRTGHRHRHRHTQIKNQNYPWEFWNPVRIFDCRLGIVLYSIYACKDWVEASLKTHTYIQKKMRADVTCTHRAAMRTSEGEGASIITNPSVAETLHVVVICEVSRYLIQR